MRDGSLPCLEITDSSKRPQMINKVVIQERRARRKYSRLLSPSYYLMLLKKNISIWFPPAAASTGRQISLLSYAQSGNGGLGFKYVLRDRTLSVIQWRSIACVESLLLLFSVIYNVGNFWRIILRSLYHERESEWEDILTCYQGNARGRDPIRWNAVKTAHLSSCVWPSGKV